jgi:predicted ribosomally synthesized peptide with nif11-like leader
MSKEHAHKFIEHVKKDPALQKKVRDASEHILKVAKDHGYEVTREEIRTVIKEHWSKGTGDDDVALNHFSEAPGF